MKWLQQIAHNIPIAYEECTRISIYESAFQAAAMTQCKLVHENHLVLANCDINELLDMSVFTFRPMPIKTNYIGKNKISQYLFGWEEGVLSFQIRYSDESDTIERVFLGINSTNKKQYDALYNRYIKWQAMESEDNEGRIFAVVQNGPALDYASVGVAKTPLIEDNYDAAVVADTKYIIENLKNPDPIGRITLLNGEPGTGKTYLIRSILDAVPDATFLLMTTGMIGAMTGPELLAFFIRNRYELMSPIVLVIEDADACLVGRNMDNLSLISSLLNVSDGIIGNLIDIRVIATTNAEIKDIDEAILRPGRLLKKVNIGKLSPQQAQKVYKRLTKKTKSFDVPVTLAEVYYEANAGSTMELLPKQSRQVGFTVNEPPKIITSNHPRVHPKRKSRIGW